MIKVLLCCGAGISSGMLAAQARKAAKTKEEDINIEARSESEVAEYFPFIDILYLGPHYASLLDEYRKLTSQYNIQVKVIDQIIYGSLDGVALVNDIINLYKNR